MIDDILVVLQVIRGKNPEGKIMTEIVKKNNLPWNLISIFLIFSAIIISAGYSYFAMQRAEYKVQAESELSTIADLKVGLIVNWRREREGDAAITLQNPLFIRHVKQFLDDPSSPDKRQEVLTPMKLLQERFKYRNVILLDAKMRTRLWVDDEDKFVGKFALEASGRSIQSRKTVLSDFHRGNVKGDIHIDILVPLLMQSDTIGVFLMRIDPQIFLYPLIQTWPTPSPTAESLLISRDGDDVVYLNELRHRKDTALRLRYPISNAQLPAAMAARGKEGVVEGIDYRGVPVLAAIKALPASPWYLVCKVDKEEIFAPVRNRAWMMFFLICTLIVASGAGGGLIWRNQRAGYYRRLYEAELEREVLIKRHEYLTKYANDIILMMDADRNIVEANERTVQTYGYSRDELLRMNIREIRDPETLPGLPLQLDQMEKTNGLIYETIHRRKNGTTFPVEISARTIVVEGKKFYQSIIRDITERKLAEEERETTVEFLRLVNESRSKAEMISAVTIFFQKKSGCEAVGIRLKEGDDYPYYEYRGFSDEFIHLENHLCIRDGEGKVIRDSFGNPVLECMCGNIICGRFDPSKPFFTANGSFWSNCTTDLLASTTETDRQARTRNRCNGEGYESVALIPLRSGNGRFGLLQLNDRRKGFFSMGKIALWERLAGYLAVTLAKFGAEESLRESEELYRSLFENMLNGFAYCRMIFEEDQPRDFVYLAVNEAFETLTGLKNVAGRKVTEVIPGIRESDPDLFERYGRVALSGKPDRFEVYVEALREWFWISVYCPEREHFVAVFDVITERKRVEEMLRKKNEELRNMTQQLWQAAKLATMGELAASIAHELNNPLATVSLRVESMLEKTSEDNSNYRELEIIEQEVERMSVLIANLLQFSRRGQQQISTVDIREEIEKTLELIYYHLHKYNIAVEREFLKDVPHVYADRQQLRQLFLNLFANASDAMPHGGTLTIRVTVSPGSGQVIIEVADTGTGITAEILQKVEEPFFTTKPIGKGTGLGLAICRRIVQEHKGTLDIISEGIPGRGTTVRISLPITNGRNAAGLINQ